MDSTSFPTSPAPTADAVCAVCGHPDALQLGGRWLCPDCISIAGSCCPEFGAWDSWSSESGVAPQCGPSQTRSVPAP